MVLLEERVHTHTYEVIDTAVTTGSKHPIYVNTISKREIATTMMTSTIVSEGDGSERE